MIRCEDCVYFNCAAKTEPCKSCAGEPNMRHYTEAPFCSTEEYAENLEVLELLGIK